MAQALLALSACLALGALGCVGPPVRTDYDPTADFRGLESFAWLEPPMREQAGAPGSEVVDPIVHNTLLDQRVRRSVEQVLTGRGFRKAEEGEADFVLRYRVVSRPTTRSYPVFTGGAGYYHRGHLGHVGYDRTETFQAGTLILDVIDPRTERITWRGWAEARTRDGHFDERRVTRYVTGILSEFPPAAEAPAEGDAG